MKKCNKCMYATNNKTYSIITQTVSNICCYDGLPISVHSSCKHFIKNKKVI